MAEGVERLLSKFRQLEAVPLDILDRVERAIVQTHTSNLLRLNGLQQPSEKVPEWATAGLHDLGCGGPDFCSCQPVYMADET
ncbi:MAG: hypothetical protein ABR593_10060 [Candidatus Limnocylindria bacterium]